MARDWLPIGTFWRSTVRRILCCIVVLLTAGAVWVAPAQEAPVPLRLVNRVEAPGETIDRTESLPTGTDVVVVPVPGDVSVSLVNLRRIPRDSLVRRARGRTVQQLTDGGTTSRRYATTPQTDRVYYVLARTPGGALYESYVNTGTRSDPIFVPGADAVMSGRMTIGPVPADARETMSRAFAAATAPASEPPPATAAGDSVQAPDTGPSDTPVAETGTSSPSPDSATRPATDPRPSDAEPPEERAAAARGAGGFSGWSAVLGGLVGLMLGGFIGWTIRRPRDRTKTEARAKPEARAQAKARTKTEGRAQAEDRPDPASNRRGETSEIRRRVTTIDLPDDPAGEPSPPESVGDERDVARLQEANEELYAENRELKRRLQKVKQFVRRIREQRSEEEASDGSASAQPEPPSSPAPGHRDDPGEPTELNAPEESNAPRRDDGE